MRALLLLLLLAAVASASSLHAWTLLDLPATAADEPQWLATWPGVASVLLLRADNHSTVQNSISVRRVLDGHDRMTGMALWYDTEFGTGDALLYVNSFDDHRVWRYQLDPETWAVRGQLQMLAPAHPMGLALRSDGDQMCVSGDGVNPASRGAHCYRISRALADDGQTIDEWWVLMAYFEWEDPSASKLPVSETVLFDSQARAVETSPRGSLWIDTKQTQLVRFPVDSTSGAFAAEVLPLPSAFASEPRLDWTDRNGTQVLVAADEGAALRIQWNGAPALSSAEPLHRWMSVGDDLLRAVVWRQVVLDPFQRLELADNHEAVLTVSFDRLPAAILAGEVSASPSQTPSISATASISHSISPSPSIPPPTPSPSAAAIVPSEESHIASGNSRHKKDNNDGYFGFFALLALPCCCVAGFLVVLGVQRWKARAANTLRDYPVVEMGVTDSEPLAHWEEQYEATGPASVRIPRARNSPFY